MSINFFNKLMGRFTGFVVSGEPVCPSCGSTRVTQRGFEGFNRRHDCQDCGSCTWIDTY